MLEFVAGNRVTLLRNGEQYFPALVAAIDAAREEVFVETYIYADDETGRLVADALARSAKRGVPTRLLIDGFGARNFAPRFRELLAAAGAELMVFRPHVSPWPFWKQRSRMRRMHRKMAAIDGSLAFVGGINIVDDFDTPERTAPQYDFAVTIEGPLAARVRNEAAVLWARVSWASIGRRWRGFELLKEELRRRRAQAESGAGGVRAALVLRDSLRHRSDIENAYLEQIEAARSEVLIANAYFFPTLRFRRALQRAARRGVAVRLLLQGKADHPFLHFASRGLYRTLLAAGVRIHEYYPSLMHAKVAVFDGRIATVGTSNIDPFSLGLAREANVFIDDAAFAGKLRSGVQEAIDEGGRRVPRNFWRRLKFGLKARIWLSYRFARLLMVIYRFDYLR